MPRELVCFESRSPSDVDEPHTRWAIVFLGLFTVVIVLVGLASAAVDNFEPIFMTIFGAVADGRAASKVAAS